MSNPEKFTEAYFASLRKDLQFSEELLGNHLHFNTTWGLFSPKGLDAGTRLLLDHLEVRENEQALDLGCGYGPIGLSIAKKAPEGHCTLVDKDFVAVEYAQKNARQNHIHNVTIQLSDGFRQVEQKKFSLVVTNLPAKTSKEHYYLFFHDALQRLEPGGRLYVVVISGLRKFIAGAFKDIFGNHSKIKQGSTYTVAMAEKR
jgi:16S rRNA (guanine1207-N2)-methyltransferase